NDLGSVLLHALQNVAVDVEGDRDCRVPEPLLHDLGVNLGPEHRGCMRVPQIVQTNTRKLVLYQEQFEGVRERSRLTWTSRRRGRRRSCGRTSGYRAPFVRISRGVVKNAGV